MGSLVYEERVTSRRTTALFLSLALLCSLVFAARLRAGSPGIIGAASLCLGVFFLFYVLNYRTLTVTITADALRLSFGVFHWTVPIEDLAGCQVDDLPPLLRYGGAGIHFMSVRGRYRASFNMLEHPRIVVTLASPHGRVRDLSFSTCRPDAVLRHLRAARAAARRPDGSRSEPPAGSDGGDT
jgi:hypothetical protein